MPFASPSTGRPAASPSATPPARGHGWLAALLLVAALLVARNLIGLDGAPIGAYVDETSIGYNAWAISTHAVDEHGAHLPLYFTAFGEYKNPVYIYTLSAILRVLPLTVTTERLPAALFGLLTCLFITLLAWQRSRSPAVTLTVLLLAALTPWLTIESRVGFEVISMVALLAAAVWCLAVAIERSSARWYAAAGVCLAVAVFAYSTGRVAVALLAGVLMVAELSVRRRRGPWVWTLFPVVLGYAVLLGWSVAHPGALIARFAAISIAADGAPPLTVAGRFVANYLTYFGPDFLLLQGDHLLRHGTHFGGVLLWGSIPLLLAGLAAMVRARRSVYARFLLGGLLVAPVSAALTNEDVPHALRAAVLMPVVFALAVEGGALLVGQVRRARAGLALVAAVIAVQGVLFNVDMYAGWPSRSAPDFDAGELDSISRAVALAGSSPVLLSSSLDPPYISAAFVLRPSPPATFTDDSSTQLLAEMNMHVVDPNVLPSQPGAIVVLAGSDPAPAHAERLFDEVTEGPSLTLGPTTTAVLTEVVYRLR